MSNNDIENAYKQMLGESTAKSPEESISAAKSLADELIETVGEPEKLKKLLTCPKCSSTNFDVRSGLGSTRINVCVKCNTKVFTKKKSNIVPIKAHNQGDSRGPYWNNLRGTSQEAPDKFTPTYKAKSKPRKNEDE